MMIFEESKDSNESSLNSKEVSFEQEFPSLVRWNSDELGQPVVTAKKVQDCCLDKQRVREAIRKYIDILPHFSDEKCECTYCKIFEELGL